MAITTIQLAHGPAVSRLSLGCMTIAGAYGETDDNESVATIHAALERGMTLLDTGDFYAAGKSELLIGRALREKRSSNAVTSVKFGALRSPEGAFLGFDGRPIAVKNFVTYSLTRLGVDHIDIYRPARLDPAVPIEETIGVIADLIKAGYVRAVGLSEVGPETIKRAHAVHPIADLQIEYSLISRGPEAQIFPLLDQLGIAVTAYGVLSRGLLSGSKPTGQSDYRAYLPRFTGENGERNQRLVAALGKLAQARGTSPAQLAIAWAMAKGKAVIPVIGARTPKQVADAAAAAAIQLSPAELAEIEQAVPASEVAGTRYAAEQMRMLDSEK